MTFGAGVPFAPKVRDFSAQANGLGSEVPKSSYALKGRDTGREIAPPVIAALQAARIMMVGLPRAVPWAEVSRPFRPGMGRASGKLSRIR
jgi:hypothetical protein